MGGRNEMNNAVGNIVGDRILIPVREPLIGCTIPEPRTGPEQTAIFQFVDEDFYLKRLFWYNLNKLPRKKKKKLKTLLRKGYSINVTTGFGLIKGYL